MNIALVKLPLPGRLVLLAAIGWLFTGCSTRNTYVLVHGAFQDARAWEKVTPLLEKEGHKVVTVNLPAHGTDATPFSEATLQRYTDTVVKAVDAQEGPVILVGHSMGGIVISQVSEARPQKVKTAVYLAAYLLKDGESLLKAAETDAESRLGANLVFENEGATARVKPEAIADIFCADCSEVEATRIRASNPSEPLAPLATPVKLTEAHFGRVPRVYIETTRDQAVGHALQKRMYGATPVEKVLTLDTGHCPFLSQPEALSRHLLSRQ